MVDKRKDQIRGAEVDRRERGEGANAYSSRDLDHFALLSEFSANRHAPLAAGGGAGPAPIDADAVAYSEGDARTFARLMGDLEQLRGVKGVAPRSRRTAGRSEYSARDREQFSALMDSEQLRDPGVTLAVKPAGPSGDPADAVAYSASDIEAFAHIMPDPEERTNRTGAAGLGHPKDADRDVGPIRVVDFGKEQARAKRRPSAGGPAIKVRYFD